MIWDPDDPHFNYMYDREPACNPFVVPLWQV